MLKKIASVIVNGRWVIMIFFAIIMAFSVWGMMQVDINYNLSKYLPAESDTIMAMDVMEDEFGLSGQAEVMIDTISLDEAMALKDKLLGVKNVERVTFYNTPNYFNDPNNDGVGSALFKLIIDGYDYSANAEGVVADLKVELADYDFTLNGQSVFNTNLKVRLSTEMVTMMILVVCIVAIILLITSSSWFEPLIFGAVIGVAILINMGTNYFLGEISYIVKSIAAILQLALSMDYAIVTMHNFNDEKDRGLSPKEAMIEGLAKSIAPVSASGLTTLAGLAAIMFMTFRIGVDIGAVLMKAIAVSMLSVFVLMPGLILLFNKPLDKLKHKPLFKMLARNPNERVKPTKYVKILNKTKKIVPAIMVAIVIVSYVLQSSITYTYVENNKRATENEVVTTFGNSNQVYMITPLATDANGGYEKQKQMIDYLSRYENSKGEKVLKDTLSYMTSIRLEVDASSAATLMNLDYDIVSQLFGTYYIDKNLMDNPTITLNDFVNFVVELIDGKRKISEDIDVAEMFGEENGNYVRAFKRLLDNLSVQMTAKEMSSFVRSLSELGFSFNVNKSTPTTNVAIDTATSEITAFGVSYSYRPDGIIYTATNAKVGTIDTTAKKLTLLSVDYTYDNDGVYEMTDVLNDYISQVYGMYYFSENPLSAPKLNLKTFIGYVNGILVDPTTSGVSIDGVIDADTATKINQFDKLIATLNSVLSADDLFSAFESFADLANVTMSDEYKTYVRIIYGNYGFQNALYRGYNANFKSFVGFIDGLVNDPRLNPADLAYDPDFKPLVDIASKLTQDQRNAVASLSRIFDMMEEENSSAELYTQISALIKLVPTFDLNSVLIDQIYGIEYYDTSIAGHEGRTLPDMNLKTFIQYADSVANNPTWASVVSANLKSQISGLKYLVEEVMPGIRTAQDLFTAMNDPRVTSLTGTNLVATEFNVLYSQFLQRYNDYKADAFKTTIEGTLLMTADGTTTVGGKNYYYNSGLLYAQESPLNALPDTIVNISGVDYYLNATTVDAATAYALYAKAGTINTTAKTLTIGADSYSYDANNKLYSATPEVGATVNEAGNTLVLDGANYSISATDILNNTSDIVGTIDTATDTFTLNGAAYKYDVGNVYKEVGSVSVNQIILTGVATYGYENGIVYANSATSTLTDNVFSINNIKYLYKNNALYEKQGSVDSNWNTATFDNLTGTTYFFNEDGDLFKKEYAPDYWYVYDGKLYQNGTEAASLDTANKTFVLNTNTYYYTDYVSETNTVGSISTRTVEGSVNTTLRRVTFNEKVVSPTSTRRAYSFYYTANSNVLTDQAGGAGTTVGSIDPTNYTVTITDTTTYASYTGSYKYSTAASDNMYTEAVAGTVDRYYFKLDSETLPYLMSESKLYNAVEQATLDPATGSVMIGGQTYLYQDEKVYSGTARVGFMDDKRIGIYDAAVTSDYVVQYVYNYRDNAVKIDFTVTTQEGLPVTATNLDTVNRTFEVGGKLFYYLSDNVTGAVTGYGEYANWNVKDTVDNLYVSTADFYAFLAKVGPDLIGIDSNYWALLTNLGNPNSYYTYKGMVNTIKEATGLIPGYSGFEINENTMYVLYCLYYYVENPEVNYNPSTSTTYSIIKHEMLDDAVSTAAMMQFTAKLVNSDPTLIYYDRTSYNESIAQMLNQQQINAIILINDIYKEYLDTASVFGYQNITDKLNGWLASVTAANQIATTVDLETIRQMYIMYAVENNSGDNNIAHLSGDTGVHYKVLGETLNKYLSGQILDETTFLSKTVGSYLANYTLTKADLAAMLNVALDDYTTRNSLDLTTSMVSLASKANKVLDSVSLNETIKQAYILYFIDATNSSGIVGGASVDGTASVSIGGKTYTISNEKLLDGVSEAGTINTLDRSFTLNGQPYSYTYDAAGNVVTASYKASFLQDQIKVSTIVDYINGLIIMPTDARYNATLSGYVSSGITQINTALNAVINIIDRQNEQLSSADMTSYISSLLSIAGDNESIALKASDIALAYTMYAVQNTFIPVNTIGDNTITTSYGQLIDYIATLLVKTNNNSNYNETIAKTVAIGLTSEFATDEEQKGALQNLVFALNTFKDIYSRTQSNVGYTYQETADLFNDSLKSVMNDTLQNAIGTSTPIELDLEASLVEQVYVKYFADYNLLPVKTATVENLVAFITNLIDTNETISGFVKDDQKELLTNYEAQLLSGGSMFNGVDHSRIIFVLNLDEGSSETFDFIDTMRSIAKIVYGDETTYLAGNSISLRDISAAFTIDMLITTVISIVAILLVVALVYSSLSLPVILILLIQSAIWISFSMNIIFGQTMFFMTYIITTCIQMGATIDYGIIVSGNYVECRKTMPKLIAMTAALKKSLTPIITSGLVLTISGFTINFVSTSIAVSSIGELLGRGTIVSVLLILVVLPQLLMLFDKLIEKTTRKTKFYHGDEEQYNREQNDLAGITTDEDAVPAATVSDALPPDRSTGLTEAVSPTPANITATSADTTKPTRTKRVKRTTNTTVEMPTSTVRISDSSMLNYTSYAQYIDDNDDK